MASKLSLNPVDHTTLLTASSGTALSGAVSHGGLGTSGSASSGGSPCERAGGEGRATSARVKARGCGELGQSRLQVGRVRVL